MSVTESRRLTLFDHARSTLGEAAATTLMDLLPPDVDQLATKSDLRVLGSDLSVLGSELRSEVSVLGAELRAEVSELRAEVHAVMAEQTRTLILSMMGIMLTGIALAFAAARLG